MRRTVVAGLVLLVAIAALWWWKREPASAVGEGRGGNSAVAAPRVRTAHEPTARASLAGRVTRASDGTPVPAATVALTSLQPALAYEVPHLAATDANGTWRLSNVPAGAYLYAATARGFEPAEGGRVLVAADAERTDLDLVLAAGGLTLRGRITDVGGGPVADARVTACESFTLHRTAEFIAVSGADGTYELSLAPGSYAVTVMHDDYARADRDLVVEGTPAPVDFVLIPGATIRGQVIARDTQQPVADALVSSDDDAETRVKTDASGHFALQRLAAGPTKVSATARGYVGAPVELALGIGEQMDDVRLLVDHAVAIRGRVVTSGTPVEGVAGSQVSAYSPGTRLMVSATALSAPDGSFEILGVLPASYWLAADGDDHAPSRGELFAVSDQDVDGAIVEVERGVTVTGRVEPAGRAQIAVTAGGERGLNSLASKAAHAQGTSDGSGVFTLHAVPAGILKLVATAADGSEGSLPVVVGSTDAHDLVIHTTRRASVRGKVIDTAGAAVAGARINARAWLAASSRYDWQGPKATTGADGTFVVVGLPAGKVRIEASDDFEQRERYGGSDEYAAVVEVELAATADRANVVITLPPRDATIRGRVVDAAGAPVADAWVTPRARSPVPGPGIDATSPVLTTADGRFELAHLVKGSYTVVADAARRDARGSTDGVQTGTSTTVTLVPRGSIAVHVTAGGVSVNTPYLLTCETAEVGGDQRYVANPTGIVVVPRLASGRYRCTAVGDAGTATGEVDVAGARAELALDAVGWAAVTGTVLDMFTGEPVAGVRVTLSTPHVWSALDAFSAHAVVTDLGGHFTAPHAPADLRGYVELRASANDWDLVGGARYAAAVGERVDVGTIKVVRPRVGPRGYLGWTTRWVGTGFTVLEITDGGPAAVGGLRVGDEIRVVDGHVVEDLGEWARTLLDSYVVGARVPLTLARGITVTLTATASPY